MNVPAIHCDGCVTGIRMGLRLVRGVGAVHGDGGQKLISVTYDPQRVTLAKIEAALAEMGYPVAR